MMTEDTRIRSDRRRRPTPAFSRYAILGGRRRGRRRVTDPPIYYVDRLGGAVWLVLLAIFLFQALDAYLTLAHLRQGGHELNPLMDRLIEHGDTLFVAVKLGVSLLGLWFLGVHKNFPLAKPGLAVLFALFAGVVGWHLFLALQLS
jgi:hypothetical protein